MIAESISKAKQPSTGISQLFACMNQEPITENGKKDKTTSEPP